MSSVALQVVEEKIINDTKECVERHKQTDFFTRVFNSRRSYEPKCKAAATTKYQDEYNDAVNALLDNEQIVDDAFRKGLEDGENQKTTKYVILAVITAAIITLIIKL